MKKPFSKNRQRAKILIANPEFKKDILEIRKKFYIPSEGIKTNEESEKWHHDFYESGEEYFKVNENKIAADISSLRKQKKFQEAFNLNRKFNNEAPINAFNISIKLILQKYKLALTWEHSMQRFILFNDIDSMWLPGNISIRQDIDKDTRLRRLLIEIDDTTTLEDIKMAWPRIKFHQQKLESYTKEKIRLIKNFDRDQEAYDLKQSGKTYSEIAEILSEKLKKVISYDDVSSYIKRHKERAGIKQA